MIHFDTSFLIQALVASTRADKRLRVWLRDGEDLAMSAVAWTEFLCGPIAERELDMVRSLLHEVVPYGTAESELAARLFNAGARRRGTLADCMIAATAIRARAPLVTMNPRDFERLRADELTIVTA